MYERVGTYGGKPLPPPESYLDKFSFQEVASGFAHVDRNQEQIREVFGKYVDYVWPKWEWATVVVLKPWGQLPAQKRYCAAGVGLTRRARCVPRAATRMNLV